MKPGDMTNEDLLDLFEQVVRAWHYDPIGYFEKYMEYDIDALKHLILKRMTAPQEKK